jgi:hypothetical protein
MSKSYQVVKQARRTTQRIYYEDGLFEIAVGLCLLVGMAARWAPYLGWLSPILIGVALPAAKKRIAGPRVGYVELGGVFRNDRRKQTIFGVGVVAGMLALLAAGWLLSRSGHLGSTDTIRTGAAVLVAMVCAALFLGLGIPRHVRHFCWYGVVFLLAGMALPFVPRPLPTIWGLLLALGALILVVCITRVARFLRRHPLPRETRV